ncbi:sulfite oxidase-like [Styela clava]
MALSMTSCSIRMFRHGGVRSMSTQLSKINSASTNNLTGERRFYHKGSDNAGYQRSVQNGALLLAGAIIGSYGIYRYSQAGAESSMPTVQAKAVKTRVYTASEVAEHKTPDKGIWVSYKDGVYDITDFVKIHPGGSKIMLGAGGAIDPFWNLYAVHQTPEVLEMLEEYRIGDLSKRDQKSHKNANDPFGNEPYRFPVFRVNSAKPFNAEPPLEVLTDSFITPNEMFYVRNHLPVPEVDPETFRLEIVIGPKSIKYSLEDLKKFQWSTVTTTIQCAGNRREEMSNYKPVKGLSWGASAIGTAKWTGPRLRDLLMTSGLNPNHPSLKHIQFDGLDCDISNSCYGASIPAKNALNHDNDVIVAVKMNGKDIPRDHGYPVRIIVPGVVGARNVKWAHRIVASDKESDSHWQQKDYKHFNPSTTYETADYSKVQSIQELPVTSAITWPQTNSKVEPSEDNMVEVQGYAWSGGGRDIIRVDVTSDGGKTWKEADLMKNPEKDDSSQTWPWTLWKVEMPVKIGQKIQFACKAVDSSYNQQPETIKPIWNLRGFLSNAWHRIAVDIVEEVD